MDREAFPPGPSASCRQLALRGQLYEPVASAAEGLLGPKGLGSVFPAGGPSSGKDPLRTQRRLLRGRDLEELERVTVIRSPRSCALAPPSSRNAPAASLLETDARSVSEAWSPDGP